MKGNEALAESALRAGCRFFFGYPITPQTELAAYMSKRMEKVGGTFLQAESEIAAINMVYGAAAAGARVMTCLLYTSARHTRAAASRGEADVLAGQDPRDGRRFAAGGRLGAA